MFLLFDNLRLTKKNTMPIISVTITAKSVHTITNSPQASYELLIMTIHTLKNKFVTFSGIS